MDPLTLAAFAIKALEIVPQLITAGLDVQAHIRQSTTALQGMQTEKRDPNDAEWAALNATIAEMRKELHAPGT